MEFQDWAFSLFAAAVIGIAIDHFRMRAELSAAKVDLANLRSFVAENYVRNYQLDKLSSEMSGFRTTLEEVVKVLYELRGANTNHATHT